MFVIIEFGVEVVGGLKKGCSCGSEGEGDCKVKCCKMMLILLVVGVVIGLVFYFVFWKK